MSGTINWIEVRGKVDAAKTAANVLAVLDKYGLDTFDIVQSAVSHYCWDKDYRAGRQQSLKAKDAEIAELKAQLQAK